MEQNRDVPAIERSARNSSGGDDDQTLVRRRIPSQRKGETSANSNRPHSAALSVQSVFTISTTFARAAKSAPVSTTDTTIAQASTNPAMPRVRCQRTCRVEINPDWTRSRSIQVLKITA